MNTSGILVFARPGAVADCVRALAALPGVDVGPVDAATGRVVVVQSAASVDDEVAGMARIQALPCVLSAALVCHYFDEAPPAPPDPAAALARLADAPPRAAGPAAAAAAESVHPHGDPP